jgi:biopolymer transport protein ExbD
MISIKGKKDYLVALESVAMTDIVLNMFIFFFISFSILYTFNPERTSRIEVRLPRASSAVSVDGADTLSLSVTRSGDYFINDERIGLAGLKGALTSSFRGNPERRLILRVDGDARFDLVAGALDVIHELDIKTVSIAAVKD